MSWIRKKKTYSRPRKPFDKARFEEEAVIVKTYGLEKKREIWKAEARIRDIRRIAKTLITASEEEKKVLTDKLKKIGLNVSNIADILALKKENWLERRLQTIAFKKGLAKTAKQARQFITHRHVKVSGKIVNKPGYIVNVNEENKIEVLAKPIKEIKEKKLEEIKNE
jgi:small subunit ribosomal protein S4